MLISFIFSYLENFFGVFYLSFHFILAQAASARDISYPPWLPLLAWFSLCYSRFRCVA